MDKHWAGRGVIVACEPACWQHCHLPVSSATSRLLAGTIAVALWRCGAVFSGAVFSAATVVDDNVIVVVVISVDNVIVVVVVVVIVIDDVVVVVNNVDVVIGVICG